MNIGQIALELEAAGLMLKGSQGIQGIQGTPGSNGTNGPTSIYGNPIATLEFCNGDSTASHQFIDRLTASYAQRELMGFVDTAGNSLKLSYDCIDFFTIAGPGVACKYAIVKGYILALPTAPATTAYYLDLTTDTWVWTATTIPSFAALAFASLTAVGNNAALGIVSGNTSALLLLGTGSVQLALAAIAAPVIGAPKLIYGNGTQLFSVIAYQNVATVSILSGNSTVNAALTSMTLPSTPGVGALQVNITNDSILISEIGSTTAWLATYAINYTTFAVVVQPFVAVTLPAAAVNRLTVSNQYNFFLQNSTSLYRSVTGATGSWELVDTTPYTPGLLIPTTNGVFVTALGSLEARMYFGPNRFVQFPTMTNGPLSTALVKAIGNKIVVNAATASAGSTNALTNMRVLSADPLIKQVKAKRVATNLTTITIDSYCNFVTVMGTANTLTTVNLPNVPVDGDIVSMRFVTAQANVAFTVGTVPASQLITTVGGIPATSLTVSAAANQLVRFAYCQANATWVQL